MHLAAPAEASQGEGDSDTSPTRKRGNIAYHPLLSVELVSLNPKKCGSPRTTGREALLFLSFRLFLDPFGPVRSRPKSIAPLEFRLQAAALLACYSSPADSNPSGGMISH